MGLMSAARAACQIAFFSAIVSEILTFSSRRSFAAFFGRPVLMATKCTRKKSAIKPKRVASRHSWGIRPIRGLLRNGFLLEQFGRGLWRLTSRGPLVAIMGDRCAQRDARVQWERLISDPA